MTDSKQINYIIKFTYVLKNIFISQRKFFSRYFDFIIYKEYKKNVIVSV